MRQLRRVMAALMIALMLCMCAQPAATVFGAVAEQFSTPTDLASPAAKTGKRSGYAVIRSGAKVFTSRKRTSTYGTVTAESYVYIPSTSVNSLTYKIRFDTELSAALSECHTYYVLSEDVRWLSESDGKALARQLEKKGVREVGGVQIPVIAFEYRKAPATPKPTATPKGTATPQPTPAPQATVNPAPLLTPTAPPQQVTAAPTPTATPGRVPIITPSPKPTKAPDVATQTDMLPVQSTARPVHTATPEPVSTSAPVLTPVPEVSRVPIITPSPTPGVATDTDLVPPTVTPESGIATDTDLTPPLLTEEEMRAVLDVSHPERQVSLWTTCSEPGYPNGSRMTLYANVSGYDGLDYTLVWEVDRNDGRGYVNAGMDGRMSVSFVINDENLRWMWRAGVILPRMDATQAAALLNEEEE